MRTVIYSFLFVMALALCLAALPAAAPAQEQRQPSKPQPTPDPQGTDVERITIRRVRLPISVVDKKGQPVPGLSAGDFQIFEDKKAQQFDLLSRVDELERLPVYVGVLMDTSSSTAGKLKFEQESAKNFMY